MLTVTWATQLINRLQWKSTRRGTLVTINTADDLIDVPEE